jgi:hypothetical protein
MPDHKTSEYLRHASHEPAGHPGTFVISLADASELAGRHTARTFGTAAS